MKNVIILLLLLIFINDSYAGKRPIIYVASLNGLTLREGPSTKSPKRELLPYGTKITNYNKTSDFDTIDGYEGCWLRIALNGKDGYVFSGYTLPIDPPTEKSATIKEYLQTAFGAPWKYDSLERNEGDILKATYYRKMVIYQEWVNYVNEYSILNLNLTIQEAYLFLYLLEDQITNCWNDYYYSSINPKKHTLPAEFPNNIDKMLKHQDYNSMEYENGYSLRIARLHTGVMISWNIYP